MKPYKLVRSRRRTIALVVSSDASLVVRAPLRASLEYIERVVRMKTEWIRRTMERVEARPRAGRKEFISGESHLFLGRTYPLMVTRDADRALSFQDGFFLNERDRDRAGALFMEWYKNEARRRIPARVAEFAQRFGLAFRVIKIGSASKRWGSCSANGNLNFTWRLMMTPPSVIDYVVIHELAHLEHKNHSKAFWKSVKCMCPDYAVSRRWLRENEGLVHPS